MNIVPLPTFEHLSKLRVRRWVATYVTFERDFPSKKTLILGVSSVDKWVQHEQTAVPAKHQFVLYDNEECTEGHSI